jgi:hypothetical protein
MWTRYLGLLMASFVGLFLSERRTTAVVDMTRILIIFVKGILMPLLRQFAHCGTPGWASLIIIGI